MKKAILNAVATAALLAIVTVPSSAATTRTHHHRHHVQVTSTTDVGQRTPPRIVPAEKQDPNHIALVRGNPLPYDECQRRAGILGLHSGQSGMADYMRECQLGHPSAGGRTR